MLGYLNRAVPLETLLEAKNTDEEHEKNLLFAERVQDIRNFAIEELGLNMSKNYTTYVHIDRDYLALIVSASAPDSFTRYKWKFPVVGAMPYKGFFDIEGSEKERKKLEKKGLDVLVRSTEAFSTLGWFKDPLYSYMRDYSAARLADLIIHELMHATVFVKNNVQFNEEIAELTGREGARLYIKSRFGMDSDEYKEMTDAEADSFAYVSFILELAAELGALYSGSLSREEKLSEKEQIINSAKLRFETEYNERFLSDNYKNAMNRPINNAYLDMFRLYYGSDDFINTLFENSGGDLITFISAAKSISDKKYKGIKDPKARLSTVLNGH